MIEVFIIGSIPKCGIKPETVLEFREAARLLVDRGFVAMNPFDRNHELSRLVYDRLHFHNDQIIQLSDEQYGRLLDSLYYDLRICDAVYLLDNYDEDPIGYAMLAMAHALGKKIYRSDKFFSPYSNRNLTLSFSCSRAYIAHRLLERCET